jgi:activator of HSP90 ATPase
MSLEFELATVISASPEVVYDTWLDTDGHTAMTGSPADVSASLGAEFCAWDGYIQGRNLMLERGKRIVQSWRTSNFEETEEDSQIEVLFEPAPEGTRLTLRHTQLPPHGTRYETGWVTHYFEPMQKYFGRS